MIITLNKIIIPSSMIDRSGYYYRISEISKLAIISKIIIRTESRKIKQILIDTIHPNVNPETREFCIPKYLVNKIYNKANIPKIISLVKQYNLSSCFFLPWEKIRPFKYKKSEEILLKLLEENENGK